MTQHEYKLGDVVKIRLRPDAGGEFRDELGIYISSSGVKHMIDGRTSSLVVAMLDGEIWEKSSHRITGETWIGWHLWDIGGFVRRATDEELARATSVLLNRGNFDD